MSKARTGRDFEDLHKWIDEAQRYIGFNHRVERHFFTTDYKEYIEKKWGEKAVVEWLFHIAIDNMETANKFAIEAYNTSYDEILVKFSGKELESCDFLKDHPNSKSFDRYEKGKYATHGGIEKPKKK